MDLTGSKKRKIYSSDSNSNTANEGLNDFICPICFQVIDEPHVTKCGHTFCFKCISLSLEQSPRCPECSKSIDAIFPNLLLNEVICKQRKAMIQRKIEASNNCSQLTELNELLEKRSSTMSIEDVNSLILSLKKHKYSLEQTSRAVQIQLLKDFLLEVRKKKQLQLDQVKRELSFVEEDIKRADQLYTCQESRKVPGEALTGDSSEVGCASDIIKSSSSTPLTASMSVDSTNDGTNASTSVSPEPSSPNLCNDSSTAFNRQFIVSKTFNDSLERKKKKLNNHFDLLENCYFNTRRSCLVIPSDDENTHKSNLLEFNETLGKFTALSKIRPLANLNYDIFSTSSIVSTIEFDKDNEYFAIAGVTKKIKLFEYSSVVRDSLEIHYPIVEMEGSSKISCVSWNSYMKGIMASSDYEGKVTIWDTSTYSKLISFQEHQKRCWSVDFNKVDTKIVASGSDDATVMLWSTDMAHSVGKIEAIANVCSVKFNPCERYNLAFGSADHCVYYYDLRNTKAAVNIFKEHTKAVSYVKFSSRSELVSASTDSLLKLWSLDEGCCKRSFKGHTNDKNFIGLTTSGDYIACGSENNSLYIYYKGVSSHALSFQFDSPRITEEGRRTGDDSSSDFVSAVCWRSGTNVIAAANSQGVIKILELV